jgi:hypothetical protein
VIFSTNGLNISEVKELIIVPTLKMFPIKWNTAAAINLLAGTMLVESHGVYIEQVGGGPAIGICQMEPATHDDCYNTFLNYTPNADLLRAVQSFIMPSNVLSRLDQMHGNLYYAFAMARVKYIRVPMDLPAAEDALGLANYHKAFYNTANGATDVSVSEMYFQQAISA